MKLTEKQKEEYLKHSNNCPFCGSPDIQGGPAEFDGTCCSQEIACQSCDETWDDIYTLTNALFTEADEEEPLETDFNKGLRSAPEPRIPSSKPKRPKEYIAGYA